MRRLVLLGRLGGFLESFAKGRVETTRVVADDGKATAFLGTVEAKRRHQDVGTRLQARPHLFHVARTILLFGQEVKDGSIVPEVDAGSRHERGSDVSEDELDCCCSFPEAAA